MPKRWGIVLLCCGVGCWLATASNVGLALPAKSATSAKSLLILPFGVDQSVDDQPGVGNDIAVLLAAQAASKADHPWQVHDLDQVRRIMESLEFRGKAIDDDYAIAIGRKLGVRTVIRGTLGKTGFKPAIILYGRVIDTEKLTVDRQTVNFDDLDLLKTKVEALAYKLGLRVDKPDPVVTGTFDVADLLHSLQPPPPPPPVVVRTSTGGTPPVAVAVPAAAGQPGLAVTLTAEGGTPSRAGSTIYQTLYREGEEIHFRISVNRKCFLTMIYQEPESNQVLVLLPLPGSTEPVEATPDKPLSIPPPPGRFMASGPDFGPHVIKVMATSEPVTIEGLNAAGLESATVAVTKSIRIGNRNLPAKASNLFESMKEFSTAETVVMIAPK